MIESRNKGLTSFVHSQDHFSSRNGLLSFMWAHVLGDKFLTNVIQYTITKTQSCFLHMLPSPTMTNYKGSNLNNEARLAKKISAFQMTFI